MGTSKAEFVLTSSFFRSVGVVLLSFEKKSNVALRRNIVLIWPLIAVAHIQLN